VSYGTPYYLCSVLLVLSGQTWGPNTDDRSWLVIGEWCGERSDWQKQRTGNRIRGRRFGHSVRGFFTIRTSAFLARTAIDHF
jgi:hypothetical protein